MLDIDFGTYPYVTSSNPTIGGCVTGLGLAANKIGDVIGVVKAYTTRVGEGPFPTEEKYIESDKKAPGTMLRDIGREFGTTTGRPRRCGWFDAVIINYTNRLNGYTALNLTKLDVLTGFESLKLAKTYSIGNKKLAHSMPASLDDLDKVSVEYVTMKGWTQDISKAKTFDQLPQECQAYVLKIYELVGVPIRWIGVGPGRDDTIVLDENFFDKIKKW